MLALAKPHVSKLGNKDLRSEYLYLEFELAKGSGNFVQAVELPEAHLAVRDSAYMHARENVLMEMDARFGLSGKEAENQKLKMQNEI
ncbi:MAG: hypothetical protein FJY10_05710 [Bacteroidetes bacterium]|nr:hypothetical protein [Bacteroidota bacterium]